MLNSLKYTGWCLSLLFGRPGNLRNLLPVLSIPHRPNIAGFLRCAAAKPNGSRCEFKSNFLCRADTSLLCVT
jgi:hypothetical protein